MKYIILFFLFLVSCSNPAPQPKHKKYEIKKGKHRQHYRHGKRSLKVIPKKDCICMKIYQPVCHKETNTTYSNACMAKCEGIKKVTEGPCTID